MQTAIAEKLKKAGYDCETAGLAQFVFDSLKMHSGKKSAVIRELMAAVRDDEVWLFRVCEAYVNSRFQDMTGGLKGKSGTWGDIKPVASIGHNQPPTTKNEKPAFDPKRLAQAVAKIKSQDAKAITDRWKLSDGRLICKLSMHELRLRRQDGDACSLLYDTIQNKYANPDLLQTAEDLLTEAEIQDCYNAAAQIKKGAR